MYLDKPTQWQPGMVSRRRTDRLLLRSKLVVISDVDSRRHRARVCSWQTRAPYKGWVPFRRLTAARGAALSTEVQQAADAVKQAPPAQEQRGVPGLSVKTADVFIVDVTNTTDGRVALIAAPDASGSPDFTKPLTQVLASDLPKRLVTQAWLAKHRTDRRASSKKRRCSSSRLNP